MMPSLKFLAAACALVIAAAAPAQAPMHARIVQPKNGDTVTTADVRVVVEAQGIEIAAAAEKRPGTGHHHLFLDTDLTAPDSMIPVGVSGIVHLGKGQSEYMFTAVPAGAHRLIDVVAGWDHVPIKPLVVDTIRFVVAAPH